MDELSKKALAAKSDEKAFAEIVRDNRKFILACAYRSVGHFVTESDDEWSVALIAYHEAVQSYTPDKGEFAALASVVIRRRLTDYLRREGRHSGEIAVSADVLDGSYEDEDAVEVSQGSIAGEIRRSKALQTEAIESGATIRDEIEALQDVLRAYGFSFYDLTECSPRSAKTKQACAEAVAAILEDEALYEKMCSTRSLPIKEICDVTGITRKVLERHRRYIIAAAVILNGDYPLLSAYMEGIKSALSS